MRCSSVNAATSSTLFAAPTTASSASANRRFGQTATNAIGSPQRATAKPSGLPRRRPSSPRAARAPNNPPTPSDAGDERADERSQALDRRRCRVGGNQFVRRPRERRENRLQSGTEERRRHADDPGEREDAGDARPEEEGKSRGAERGRPDECDRG